MPLRREGVVGGLGQQLGGRAAVVAASRQPCEPTIASPGEAEDVRVALPGAASKEVLLISSPFSSNRVVVSGAKSCGLPARSRAAGPMAGECSVSWPCGWAGGGMLLRSGARPLDEVVRAHVSPQLRVPRCHGWQPRSPPGPPGLPDLSGSTSRIAAAAVGSRVRWWTLGDKRAPGEPPVQADARCEKCAGR